MQIEKLIDAAIDYRIAKLKAREQGIIGITDCGGKREEFQIYDKDDFEEIIKTREYIIIKRDGDGDYRYEYKTKVAGLNFICLTPCLFKEEDKKYITEEEDV
jgi:hypothetical protein